MTIPNTRLLSGWGREQENSWISLALQDDNLSNYQKDENLKLTILRSILAERPQLNCIDKIECPPFMTGIICHFSYEAATFLESSLKLPIANHRVPIVSFNSFDATISTHLPSGKTYIYATSNEAADRLESIIDHQLALGYLR